MEAAVVYLGKVNLYFIVFFACYWLLFRKHTFFRWNRAYLLVSLLAAVLLPLITFSETIMIEPEMQPASRVLTNSAQPDAAEETNWLALLGLGYLAGVVAMLMWFAKSLFSIVKVIRKGDCYSFNDYYLVISDLPGVGSFSFFKRLIIHRKDFEEAPETILAHEQVHIRQWHSLDIIFIEILKACFWINPVIWFYKKALQITHEYLADEVAGNRDQYASFLVSYSLGVPGQSLQNTFLNSSQLKSRIRMIYSRRTSPWSLTKYALVLPVVGVMIFSTAARRYEFIETVPAFTKSEVVNTEVQNAEDIAISGVVTNEKGDPLPGASIVLKNAQRGTSTDGDGKFTLNVPQNGTIVASHVAYAPAELRVKKKTTEYKFVLKPAKTTIRPDRDAAEAAPAQQQANSPSRAVFTVAEQNAEFPGGAKGLAEYLKNNLKYPEPAWKANVSGIVFVTFRVDEEGNVGAVRIAKGVGFGTDAESVRLVKNMPKWNPAVQNGKPVTVEQTIEIRFDLKSEQRKRAQGFKIPDQEPSVLKLFEVSKIDLKKLFGETNEIFDTELFTKTSFIKETSADDSSTPYRFMNYQPKRPYAFGMTRPVNSLK